jgi:hypothetical protein
MHVLRGLVEACQVDTRIQGRGVLECNIDTNFPDGVVGELLYGKVMEVRVVLEAFIGYSVCQGVSPCVGHGGRRWSP